MDRINISQIKQNQADEFFELYKNIAKSDFNKWAKDSKEMWFTDSYSLEYWKQLLTENKLPILVVEERDKMVGYVMLEGINFGVGYLGWIGILKEYQGKGLGSMLMKEMEKWCRNNEIHKIELETQEPELQHFYEKHGYKLEGIRKNSWQHLDNYMFGKEL